MNSLKISYDGRVTFWNARLQSIQRPKASKQLLTAEWALFLGLPPEGKRIFLLSSMGLSHVANLDNELEPSATARRGSKGITAYGRSLVRMGAQRLEDEFGLKQLSFLTLTLPESLLGACTPQTWASVVNRFVKSLRRHLARLNLSSEIVGCTEVQLQRAARSSGIPPLHLHLVFQGRERGKSWACRPMKYRSLWARACLSVWGGNHQFQSSSRVESLRVSGVSYLGKYMSKGSGSLKTLDPNLLPSAWYTITRKLKDFVKRSEFRISGDYVSCLYYWLRDHDYLIWARNVWSEEMADGSRYLMAWIGAIKSRARYWDIVKHSRLFASRKMGGELIEFSAPS